MASSHDGIDELESLSNSSLKPHLNTNYSPSTSELSQIKEMLISPLKKLSSLSHEVLLAKQRLAQLEAQASALQSAVDQHQALLTPIRRMPDEVIQTIFYHCLPDSHLPILDPLTAPILLTHISRTWRALAFSEPRLWSALHIPIPYARPEDELMRVTNKRLEAVDWFFGFSGSTGLSVSIWWPPQMRNAWRTERMVPTGVMGYRARLVNLELDLPNQLLAQIVRYPGWEFPSLRRIAVRLKVAPGKDPRGSGIADGTIWTAEGLERVIWQHVEDDVLKLPLNWEALKELEVVGSGMTPVAYLSVGDARALLKRTEKLERFKVRLMHYEGARQPDKFPHPGRRAVVETLDDEDENSNAPEPEILETPSTPETLILPSLTHLDIYDTKFDYDQPQLFSPQLQLPNLVSLTYQTHYSTYSELQSLASLFHLPIDGSEQHQQIQCPCPLLDFLRTQVTPIVVEEFTIHAESLSQRLFFDVLNLLPRLRKLTIIDTRRLTYFDFNDQVEVAPDDNLLRFLCGFSPSPASSTTNSMFEWGADAWDEQDASQRLEDIPCPSLQLLRVSRSAFSEGGLVQFCRFRTDVKRIGRGEVKKRLERVEVGLARMRPRFWYLPKRAGMSDGVKGKGKAKETGSAQLTSENKSKDKCDVDGDADMDASLALEMMAEGR
ncbi:hypothetical protein BKA70DRAFT_257644 [Coprinopsis sp. MPI-PUGE-AT-0042]|nr:hypothetical protein BKA70DRAFT_257644 [Coprinopsis sp. MPI-PUGE-AT-0042]